MGVAAVKTQLTESQAKMLVQTDLINSINQHIGMDRSKVRILTTTKYPEYIGSVLDDMITLGLIVELEFISQKPFKAGSLLFPKGTTFP